MKAKDFRAGVAAAGDAWRRSPRRMIRSAVIRATFSYFNTALWVTIMVVIILGVVGYFNIGPSLELGEQRWMLMLLALVYLCLIVGMYAHFSSSPASDPEGFLLQRDKAPKLFETIDRIQRETGAPRIDRVYLIRDFTAAYAVKTFRFIPIVSRRDLLLGFPLFQILSEKEFESVIGHELRHSRGGAARAVRYLAWVAAFLDRMIEWERAQSQTINPHYVSLVAGTAGIHARRIVIQRGTEFDSDAEAARVTSPEIAGGSLLRFCFWEQWFAQECWPRIRRRAVTEDLPPDDVFTELEGVLEEPVPDDEARRILERLDLEQARPLDLHPSLGERLAALRLPPPGSWDPPEYTPPSLRAWNLLPRDTYLHYRQLFSRSWKAAILSQWRQWHVNALGNRKEIEELDAIEHPSTEQQWRRLELSLADEAPRVRETALREWLSRHPDHREAHWALGCTLLHFNSTEAIPHLERGAVGSTPRIITKLKELAHLYEGLGRYDDLAIVEAEQEEIASRSKRADYERSKVFRADRFLPHGLSQKDLAPVVISLARYGDLQMAWLVRKEVEHFTDVPAYVLLVEYVPERQSLATPDVYHTFACHLAATAVLPGETLVQTTRFLFKTPKLNIQAVEGALIFDRSKAG